MTWGGTELLEYRDRFPILADTTYLINHSLAAMPAEAERRLSEYSHTWKTRGIRAWGEGWWTMPLTVGDQIGRLIGARPGTVVMHQNVTIAAAVVLSCFDFANERRRVVYVEGEFPSVRYLLQAHRGAEVVVVPDQDSLAAEIDERTLLVPVSHVLYRTGEIQDVAAITRLAHEAGAHVLLDAYQSVGTVPLDVSAFAVDFAAGGSVKWLCGGPGAGWLYVRPDLVERLEPSFVGWQGHERPFGFEPELEYASGVARFLTGTPNVPALVRRHGRLRRDRGGRRRAHPRAVDRPDRAARGPLDAAGFEVTSPRDPQRRGGTVTVRTPTFEAVHAALAEREILCDFRPETGLRLGPHFFNTDDELRFAVAQIAEIVESGAAERHTGATARF